MKRRSSGVKGLWLPEGLARYVVWPSLGVLVMEMLAVGIALAAVAGNGGINWDALPRAVAVFVILWGGFTMAFVIDYRDRSRDSDERRQ